MNTHNADDIEQYTLCDGEGLGKFCGKPLLRISITSPVTNPVDGINTVLRGSNGALKWSRFCKVLQEVYLNKNHSAIVSYALNEFSFKM